MGYVIYTPRAAPSLNKITDSLCLEITGLFLTFLKFEVSELWHKAMVNNFLVFNLSNCSVAFEL